MTQNQMTQKINEYSTDETISELFFEDGYDKRDLAGTDFTFGFVDFEDFAHAVRMNAETGSLVWTERHIVGTRNGFQFEIVKVRK